MGAPPGIKRHGVTFIGAHMAANGAIVAGLPIPSGITLASVMSGCSTTSTKASSWTHAIVDARRLHLLVLMLNALLQGLVLMQGPLLVQGLVLTLLIHHHLLIEHPCHWSW